MEYRNYRGRYQARRSVALNHLFHQFPTSKSLIRLLQEYPTLEIPLNQQDKAGKTLFMEILDVESKDTLWMFESIFIAGYQKTEEDVVYLSKLMQNNEQFNDVVFENICMAYCFIRINHPTDYKKVQMKHRELCVLFSAKCKRIINFRFSNFLQVANNALEHYNGHNELFIRAFSIYGWIAELEAKASYQKKVEALRRANNRETHDFDTLFSAVFPELF